MSEGTDTDNLPASETDIFKKPDKPPSIAFTTDSKLAIFIAFSLMLYIVMSSTKDNFTAFGGSERVKSMVVEAKQLDASLNKDFMTALNKATADNNINPSELALIETKYKAMIDNRDKTANIVVETQQAAQAE